MKMKNITFFLVLCALSGCVSAGEAGVFLKRGHGVTSSNLAHYAYNDLDYAVAGSVHYAIDAGFVDGFVANEDGSLVYSLSRGPVLHAGDIETRSHIGSWPLTRWEGELAEVEQGGLYWNGYMRDSDWGGLVSGHGPSPDLGCIPDSPLRYGHFVNEQESVVVALLGEKDQRLDVVVFSPDQEAVVFSARLAQRDDYDTAGMSASHIKWQYQGQVFEKESLYPGFRMYAKLFVHDFDGDGKKDLVQWRKLFQSRTVNDPVKGYKFTKQVLRFYKMEKGRFYMQDIESAMIMSMLSEQSLTWQKGFPSHSECPGEERELIPEMHDPLLNDPDVLQ